MATNQLYLFLNSTSFATLFRWFEKKWKFLIRFCVLSADALPSFLIFWIWISSNFNYSKVSRYTAMTYMNVKSQVFLMTIHLTPFTPEDNQFKQHIFFCAKKKCTYLSWGLAVEPIPKCFCYHCQKKMFWILFSFYFKAVGCCVSWKVCFL